VDEGIIERGKDAGDTEDELALGDVRAELNGRGVLGGGLGSFLGRLNK
jgi:hypothetical protein